jgi:hypothetical protein
LERKSGSRRATRRNGEPATQNKDETRNGGNGDTGTGRRRIQYPEARIQKKEDRWIGCRLLGCRVTANPGARIQNNPKDSIQNPGARIQNSEAKRQEFRIQEPESRIT